MHSTRQTMHFFYYVLINKLKEIKNIANIVIIILIYFQCMMALMCAIDTYKCLSKHILIALPWVQSVPLYPS